MTTTARVLGGFAAAACTILVAGALATRPASASTCTGMPGSPFELGIFNTCNTFTTLAGSANPELHVQTSLADGIAVFGRHSSMTGGGVAIEGYTDSTGNGTVGVTGAVTPATTGFASSGVYGLNNGTNFGGYGVYGRHMGQGIGVYGEAVNGFAVSGYSPYNWSGYFQGSVNIVGTLYKSSGAFRIDNPIDPTHSYLQHSFVESPDMKNVYDGNVTTNGNGFATVKLPAYFEALNKDFRYQLTTLGEKDWDSKAGISREIKNNSFTIRTSKRNVKVSWQVTGIRQDAYANAHRIQAV